jgi:hypothetical protein
MTRLLLVHVPPRRLWLASVATALLAGAGLGLLLA